MNATEITRKSGKKELNPQQPVVVDTTQPHVPPMSCPVCTRGMTPIVERWRPPNAAGVRVADCKCTLNNCRFVYTPATVRVK
jgi:hypothetical protein